MLRHYLLALLVGIVVIVSGCVGVNSPEKPGGQESVSTSPSPSITNAKGTSTPSSETVNLSLFNRTHAINASLIPRETFTCSKEAPSVIKAYYTAAKDENNVTAYFDESVVDVNSLEELHEALYLAVDFEKLDVSNITCVPVSTQLVACKYHYSAVLTSGDGRERVERDYVTFLSGDSCRIIWTEAEG